MRESTYNTKRDFERFQESPNSLAALQVQLIWIDKIKETQNQDPNLVKIREEILLGKWPKFNIYGDGMLKFGDWLCVLNNEEVEKIILTEAHYTTYITHLISMKMFKDLQEIF